MKNGNSEVQVLHFLKSESQYDMSKVWIAHLDGGPKRVNHAAVCHGHKIYCFGGYCTGENSRIYTSMDVHVLNTTTFRWTKHPVSDLPYFENDDILPYKRYGHTAVVYCDKVYIWGGRNDRASDGVLFCFDTTWHCWTAPKTTGCLPLPRDGHTACVWRHYMIIFGGYEEETDSFAESVYALDLKKMEWALVRTEGFEPTLRDFHTAVVLNNRMYLFGGRGGTTLLGEEVYSNVLWYLDLETFKWVRPQVFGEIPIGRRSHSACESPGSKCSRVMWFFLQSCTTMKCTFLGVSTTSKGNISTTCTSTIPRRALGVWYILSVLNRARDADKHAYSSTIDCFFSVVQVLRCHFYVNLTRTG
jgi:N-acetylneuraminic acid mutarotase